MDNQGKSDGDGVSFGPQPGPVATRPRRRRVMWVFIRGAAASLVLGVIATFGLAGSADAVPVTYDFTLTATAIGSPFAGISALPAGPFSGSFTFAAPPAPDLDFALLAPTDFALTIGTASWDEVDLLPTTFSTDALGQVTWFELFAFNGIDFLEISLTPAPFFNGWIAQTGPCTPELQGNCIAGEPGSIALVPRVDAVPEPATLALFGAGLAGLGWIGRKRQRSPR